MAKMKPHRICAYRNTGDSILYDLHRLTRPVSESATGRAFKLQSAQLVNFVGIGEYSPGIEFLDILWGDKLDRRVDRRRDWFAMKNI